MRICAASIAVLIALPSHDTLVTGKEQTQRLRNGSSAVKPDDSATLAEKTRQLLLDFSGYEFWDSYSNSGTSMEASPPSHPPLDPPTYAPVGYPPTLPPYPTGKPVNPPTFAPVVPPTPYPTGSRPTIATDAPVTAAPTNKPTFAPVVPPTPFPTGTAPVVTTPAPQAATPAPQAVTPPPQAATPAPQAATPAPQAVTPPPQAATPAPQAATPAPQGTTPAPQAATPAPQITTPTPQAPTPAPQDSTVGPEVTPAPQAPTPAPTTVPVATPAPITEGPSVRDRLTPFVLQGGAEFDNPESYQSQALAQTEEQIGVDDFTDSKLVQYYVLYCIYFATNGVSNIITDADPRFAAAPSFPTWDDARGWEENNVDPCSGSWEGIVCGSNLVTEVNLFDNILTGAWPLEIQLLAADNPSGAGAIFKIDLFDNPFLFNNFDNSWMSNLGPTMERLYFQATAFAGDLVPLPVNLFEFDCSFSLIEGGLTNENFAGLNALNWAFMDGNAYNNSVPSVFGGLAELEFLFISDSFISGDLSYMNGMPKMIEHWIDVNPGLGGTIPAFIGEIQTLQSFSVTQANLVGPLPSELGNLNNMVQLWFYANSLTGQIPTELAIRTMEILELEGNSFTGSMPPEICQLTQFPNRLNVLGADCDEINCRDACCTCCSVQECNPF